MTRKQQAGLKTVRTKGDSDVALVVRCEAPRKSDKIGRARDFPIHAVRG